MQTRRNVLSHSAKVAAMLAAAGVLPGVLPGLARAQASSWNASAFDAKNMADLMKALGAGAPSESKDVTLTAPDIGMPGGWNAGTRSKPGNTRTRSPACSGTSARQRSFGSRRR